MWWPGHPSGHWPRLSGPVSAAVTGLPCPRGLLRWDVYRTAFGGHNGLADALAERGVRVDGLDDLIAGQLAAHGDGELADQVGGVGADDVRAQDFVVFAQNDFGEALRLVAGDSFANGCPGETLDAQF